MTKSTCSQYYEMKSCHGIIYGPFCPRWLSFTWKTWGHIQVHITGRTGNQKLGLLILILERQTLDKMIKLTKKKINNNNFSWWKSKLTRGIHTLPIINIKLCIYLKINKYYLKTIKDYLTSTMVNYIWESDYSFLLCLWSGSSYFSGYVAGHYNFKTIKMMLPRRLFFWSS